MKILFATDGSKPAAKGEQLITKLFDRTSPIHVFTVTPQPQYDWVQAEPGLDLASMDVPLHAAKQVASEAADRLTGHGFKTSTEVADGHPGAEILKAVDEGHFDLVVLGASHTTWAGNLLMGSVSTYVLHHAPCSVLITHREPTGAGTVLAGVDGSEVAFSSLRIAAGVLDRDRCSIEVATVASHPGAAQALYPGGLFVPIKEHESLEKERIERARLIAHRGAALLEHGHFSVSEAVLLGRPADQLLKEADNITADLVVVGSRGMGTVRRTFLGSVSDQLARHAPATLVGRIAT